MKQQGVVYVIVSVVRAMCACVCACECMPPPPPSLPPPVQGRGGGQWGWEMGGAGRRWRRGDSSIYCMCSRGSERHTDLTAPCLHGHVDVPGSVGRERAPGPLIAAINITLKLSIYEYVVR